MTTPSVEPAHRAALATVRNAAGQAGHILTDWAPGGPTSTVLPPAYHDTASCLACGRAVDVLAWHGHTVRATGLESESSGLAYASEWRPGPCPGGRAD